MYFDDAVEWTDGSDTVQVSLASLPQLPLSIWVPSDVAKDAGTPRRDGPANLDDMQCGVGFEVVVPIDKKPALGSMSVGCSNLGPVKAVGYSTGRLNVYYVMEITDGDTAIGVHCAADPTVILIGAMFGVNATLSHEIGHALTLDHTNDIDGLDTLRLTSPYRRQQSDAAIGVNQTLLSTGQCFRANLNSSSAINTLGARTGPRRMPPCQRHARVSRTVVRRRAQVDSDRRLNHRRSHETRVSLAVDMAAGGLRRHHR